MFNFFSVTGRSRAAFPERPLSGVATRKAACFPAKSRSYLSGTPKKFRSPNRLPRKACSCPPQKRLSGSARAGFVFSFPKWVARHNLWLMCCQALPDLNVGEDRGRWVIGKRARSPVLCPTGRKQTLNLGNLLRVTGKYESSVHKLLTACVLPYCLHNPTKNGILVNSGQVNQLLKLNYYARV